MAKRRSQRLRGTPASGRTESKPRRAANAPQGSGRRPTRQSSSKPRRPKATQAMSRPQGRRASASRKPSTQQWYKLIQEAEKKSGSKVAGRSGRQAARKSKSVSRKSTQSGNKRKSAGKKTSDSGKHKKAAARRGDKRTKAYKEREKWRRSGHLIRLSKLRSRLWKLAPGEFGSYSNTLELAKCMLEKNDGRIPRSNADLLALMAVCLDEVGVPGEGGPVSPTQPPDPNLVVIGEWDFYELDDLMLMLPSDFEQDIVSNLSVIQRFKRVNYVYADTFKEYVEYVNRKIAQGALDKYHPIAIEWRYDSERGEWYLWVYELDPSGYESEESPLGIPRRGSLSGKQAPIVGDEERQELEEFKEEVKSIHDERQDLNKLLELLLAEKAGLVDEYRMYMQAGDKESMLAVAAEAAGVRQAIINTRRQITGLKKGRKPKKVEVKKKAKKKTKKKK